MKGIFVYTIGLGLGLSVSFLAVKFLVNYFSGKRTVFFGARNYRIKFVYKTNVDVFGPECEEQLDSIMFWLNKVANHVSLYELNEYYFTKEEVQEWSDEYYVNLDALCATKTGVEKGRLDEEDYRIALDFLKGRTARAIENLRELNKELVKKINEQDDARERELRAEEEAQKYSLC